MTTTDVVVHMPVSFFSFPIYQLVNANNSWSA